MRIDQKGQAAVEFAVAITALLALVLAIPIVAKIANANILSIQALDYAAWRARDGNTDNEELSREINDRYFGETALVVDDEQINHQGAMLGTGRDHQQIYQNNTVSINYNSDDSDDNWKLLEDQAHLGIYDKKGTVSINLPLQNLDVIPEMVGNLTIAKSLYIDNQALTAQDARQIQSNMDGFEEVMIPYNNGYQAFTNDVYNVVIDAVSVIDSLPFFNTEVFSDYSIDDVKIDHDAVPEDRLN